MPLVDLLNGLLRAGRNGLPPTPDTSHLGCSYHLHSSHRFLSTWGAVMLKQNKISKLIFKVPTSTSGIPPGHILTNLIINALSDANADRKLEKIPNVMDSERLKTPKTDCLLKG